MRPDLKDVHQRMPLIKWTFLMVQFIVLNPNITFNISSKGHITILHALRFSRHVVNVRHMTLETKIDGLITFEECSCVPYCRRHGSVTLTFASKLLVTYASV